MFLGRLNPMQQKAFIALALKMVKADGRFDKRERQLIENFRYETGLYTEVVLPDGTVEELAQNFDTREARKIVMIESVALAYVDGECCDSERVILRALALSFDFSEQEAAEIEAWVLRHREIIMNAEVIIGGE